MTDPTAAWSLLHEPRDWRRSALDAWLANNHRGIVEVVTGAGKTVLAELCIFHFIRSNPHGKIVIVVPTTALLDQWYVSLREELGVQDGQIATYSGEGRPECSAQVNIMVLNTARESAPLISREAPVLLVVDECHRAGSPENARALRGDHAAALGMSATPHRDYDEGLDDFLIPALGPVIFEYGYNEAARDGVIAPFDLVNVRIEVSVVYDRDDDLLRISDNAMGMSYEELDYGLRVGARPAISSGRSQFGMGMKTAACWIGNHWTVRTKRLGDTVEHTVEVDVEHVADGMNDLPHTQIDGKSPDDHYTLIEIRKHNREFRGRTIGKIRNFLRSMYREDLSTDMLTLLWNGEQLKWDDSIHQFLKTANICGLGVRGQEA